MVSRYRISRMGRRFLAFAFGIDATVSPIEAMLVIRQIEALLCVFFVFGSIVLSFAGILAHDIPTMYIGLGGFIAVVIGVMVRIGCMSLVESVTYARELNALKERNIRYLNEIQSIDGLYGIAHDALQAILDTELVREDGHCNHCGADLNGRPNPTDAEYHEKNCGYPDLEALITILRERAECYIESQRAGVR